MTMMLKMRTGSMWYKRCKGLGLILTPFKKGEITYEIDI